MVVIAINGETGVNFPDRTGCQLIPVQMSPAVVNQISAILRPVGRFNNVVELLEDRPGPSVYIDRFQNTDRIAFCDKLSQCVDIHLLLSPIFYRSSSEGVTLPSKSY